MNKIAATLERDKLLNGSTDIPGLQKIHDIGFHWNAAQGIFLGLTISTTIVFILQVIEAIVRWYFKLDRRSPFQKCLVLISLFLNDFLQSIVTAIVLFAVDDVNILYFFSTLLGTLGNYIMFFAYFDTPNFHYPKAIVCHVALMFICFLIQFTNTIKAAVT